jgi:hypothetical protein
VSYLVEFLISVCLFLFHTNLDMSECNFSQDPFGGVRGTIEEQKIMQGGTSIFTIDM